MSFKRLLKNIIDYLEDWIISYILIVIISGISSFVVQMIATGLPLYCVDIGKSTAQSGIMAGFYSAALILSRPLVGKWTDEKGKWNISFFGIILMILSLAGMAFLPLLLLLNVYQLVEGLAFSALSTALAALVVDILPPHSIIKGIALFTVSKSLMISLGASFAVSFAEKFGSSKIFLATFILMVIGLILILILKKKPIQESNVQSGIKQEINDSEYKGLAKFVDIGALPVCLIQFIFTFSLTLGTCYLPAYAQTIGIAGVGVYYTISALTMLASRTILAKLLDSIKPKIAFVIGMVLAISTTFGILFCNKLVYFALLSVPNAIGICMINPMLNVKATANVPTNRRGVASSTYYASLDLGSGAGSMLWGLLVPVIGYSTSFALASILLLLATIYGIFVINRKTI